MTIDRLKHLAISAVIFIGLIWVAKVGSDLMYQRGYDAGLIKGYTVSYKVVRAIGEGPAISFLDKMEIFSKGGKI